MLMVAPRGREKEESSEETPYSSFVIAVETGREPLELVVLAATTQSFQMCSKKSLSGKRASSATMGT